MLCAWFATLLGLVVLSADAVCWAAEVGGNGADRFIRFFVVASLLFVTWLRWYDVIDGEDTAVWVLCGTATVASAFVDITGEVVDAS